MTWKEFKERAEKLGVKDEDEIFYIDIHLPEPTYLSVDLSDELGVKIW